MDDLTRLRDAFETLGIDNPNLVIAMWVESGWRPTDDQLRAMGGEVVGFAWESVQGTQWGGPDGTGHRTECPAWRFPRIGEATDE